MKKQPYKQFRLKDKMMDIKIPYSLTLNAEDQHCNFDDRIERMYKYYKKRLSKLHFEYQMYMEISTPLDGRSLRVHLHGIFYFDNYQQLKRWYSTDNELLTKSMHVDIDDVNDPMEWSVYCTKNDLIMSNITSHHRIQSVGYSLSITHGIPVLPDTNTST